jgi:hypothetical protein
MGKLLAALGFALLSLVGAHEVSRLPRRKRGVSNEIPSKILSRTMNKTSFMQQYVALIPNGNKINGTWHQVYR